MGSDPTSRMLYDQEMKGGRSSYYGFGNSSGGKNKDGEAYDKYRDAFDTAAASMSESDLETIAKLAGVFGAVLSSRMLGSDDGKTRKRSGGGSGSSKRSVLVSAGSAMGALAASASVRALHRDSLRRLSHKEECKKAVERGEPMPPPPKTSSIGTVFKKALETVANDMEKKDAKKKQEKENAKNSSSETYNNSNNTNYRDCRNDDYSSETNTNSNGGNYYNEERESSSSTSKFVNKMGKKLWKAALKEGVKVAQRSSTRVH